MEPLSFFVATALMLAAAANDISRRRIPNGLCCGVALAGACGAVVALHAGGPASAALTDVAVALVILVAGSILFNFALIGGGDVKLLSAAALWVGAGAVPELLLWTSLAGGMLAAGFIVAGRLRRTPSTLPYGVAIAAGSIAAAWPS